MEKNKLILMLAIGTLLTPVLSLQAVENISTTTAVQTQNTTKVPVLDKAKMDQLKAKLMLETKAIKGNLDIQKTEIEKLLADKKGEVKTRIAIAYQEKVRTLVDNIFNKFNSKTSKLSEIDAKVSTKMNTLEKSGVNLSEARAQYAIAKASLDKTISEVMAIRIVLMEQITTDTSKGTFRDLVKKAEESMQATGKEYNKIIPLIVSRDNKVEEGIKTDTINKQ
jgi:hypothetical protein